MANCDFQLVYTDAYEPVHGGKWFYRQNKPGTPWFDAVNNTKGWTVDFDLEVLSVENSKGLSDTDPPSGLGVYVNDGARQETLYFLEQEIVFKNSNVKVTHDTTQTTSYRLIGKENNLQLYGRRSTSIQWQLIADTRNFALATSAGNARKPRCTTDSVGNLHAVWMDDGNSAGILFYAKYDGISWSPADIIANPAAGVQNPDIAIDSNGVIYVVYETKESDHTDIGFIYNKMGGWTEPIRFSYGPFDSKHPSLTIDSENNVHIVWEDARYGHPEIIYSRWDHNKLAFVDEHRVTQTDFGAYRPAITSYLSDIFISYTVFYTNGTTAIQIGSFNYEKQAWSNYIDVSSDSVYNQVPDYSDILASVEGKIFVVWHDVRESRFEIYSRIYSPLLKPISDIKQITISAKDSKFPVLSSHATTGDVYVVWHDTRLSPDDVNPYFYGPYYFDPYRIDGISHIYCAFYENLTEQWHSSGQGEYDVLMHPSDDRSMKFPAIPDTFIRDLHILYESEMANLGEYFIPSNELFCEIRDAVWDLSYVKTFDLILQPYGDRDLLVSSLLLRKEIRFGNFSDTLSSKSRWQKFSYYLLDAVPPFTLVDISHNSYPINEIRVNDAKANDQGDAWLATTYGLYFYYKETGALSNVTDSNVVGKDVRCLAFDRNNRLFASEAANTVFSLDHILFATLLYATGSSAPSGTISSLCFDKNNRLIVGTESIIGSSTVGGVYIYDVTETTNPPDPSNVQNINPTPSLITLTAMLKDSFAVGSFVSSLAVDDNNVIWAATRSGIYRYLNGNVLQLTIANGLASNRVNDISIRNTAIRYVATAAGLQKMIGMSFDTISSESGSIWNNNVKSVAWQEPNTIWAGTLSEINQIFEIKDNIVGTQVFEPTYYSSHTALFDDHQIYYLVVDDIEHGTIPENAEIEVYINGTRIGEGYEVSLSNLSYPALKFNCPLLTTDVVTVIIRGDITLMASFAQSEAEKNALGENIIRVKSIQSKLNKIYVSTEGDLNEIKLNDATSPIPYDSVFLDTTPPTGCVSIVEQIDNSMVRVAITDATDGISGSGIDKMIVSNYPNFTTDGTAAQAPVAFSTSAIHDLGITVGSTIEMTAFTSGIGSKIQYFSDNNKMYAATSKPGVLYKMNNTTGVWAVVASYANDEYVDVIERFNNKFLVGVGHDMNPGKLYIYEDNDMFLDPVVRTVTGTRIFSSQQLLNKVYLGTGDDGRIYVFDGYTLSIAYEGISKNIYSLTTINNILFAATGDSGRIYRIDPDENASLISHQDSDVDISAIGAVTINGNKYIFAGTSTQGKILRSLATQDSYNQSFKTINSKVSSIKESNGILYAAIGRIVYAIGQTATWSWKAEVSDAIQDLVIVDKDIYFITLTKIYKIIPPDIYRYVYLKLIDKAGNESALYDNQGHLIPCRYTNISIRDLKDYISENRILELDEFGNIVYTLTGSDAFYSADKIEQEEGIYDSQIFNGTNGIVRWDEISWVGNEPSNTDLLIYVRTNSSTTDILTENWVGPYTLGESSGVDVGFLTGQFIQFRAVLRSRSKDISPSLTRVVIKSITSQAVHFFTTNFVVPSRVTKGILTSQKILPVAADIVFGINTTDSVEWADYQIVDENRLFNVSQFGSNLRVGIKLISPSRSTLSESHFDEYGPYGSYLYINTVDFDFTNIGSAATFDFRIIFHDDIGLTHEVYSIYSGDMQQYFSVDGSDFPASGKTIGLADTSSIILSPPGDANLQCNTYYFVKIECYNHATASWSTVSDDHSYIAGCSASFVDSINFDFTNTTGAAKDFHFRIRFYEDSERTNLYLTEFSGNDRANWTVDGIDIPIGGSTIDSAKKVTINYVPENAKFTSRTFYYLIIDAFDGTNFMLASKSYTFEVNDPLSFVYCGPYSGVPIIKNFGILFELLNNELITLNLS